MSELALLTIKDISEFSQTAIRSGLLPASIKTPEAAFVIIATGKDLGLSAMESLRSIHVIEGKPVLSSQLIVALAMRHPLCLYFQLVESGPLSVTYETHRKGNPSPTKKTYTIEDAKRAQLAGRPNWQKHPTAMLEARCAAALARAVYPDGLLGVYEVDEGREISGEYKTTQEPPKAQGRVIDAPAKAPDPIDEMLLPPKGADLQELADFYLAEIEKSDTFDEIKDIGHDLKKESEEVKKLVRVPFEARWNALKPAAPKLTEGPRSPNPASPRSSATGMRPEDYDQIEEEKTAKVNSPQANDPPAPEWTPEKKAEKPFNARAAVETARAKAVHHPPVEQSLNRDELHLLTLAGQATSPAELDAVVARIATVFCSPAATKAIHAAINKKREALTAADAETVKF